MSMRWRGQPVATRPEGGKQHVIFSEPEPSGRYFLVRAACGKKLRAKLSFGQPTCPICLAEAEAHPELVWKGN